MEKKWESGVNKCSGLSSGMYKHACIYTKAS